MERRPRFVRGGAAALALAALVASLSILTHPSGTASAATSAVAAVATPAIKITHGCDTGDGNGDWVEATLSPTSRVADPPIVQVGLAVSANSQDTYPDSSGPVLVSLARQTTVRLDGPIKGAHLFVRKYGDASVLTTQSVPAACQHVAKTDLGNLDGNILFPANTGSCLNSAASVTAKVFNDGSTDGDFTVLLVQAGVFIGNDRQGKLVHVKAGGTQGVNLEQSYNSNKKYKFEVRLLSQDGAGSDGGVKTVVCDTQGTGHGGRPTTAPPHPSVSVSVSAPVPTRPASHSSSSKPSASHSSRTATSHARATLTASTTTARRSNAPVAGAPSTGGNDQSASNTASPDAGGAVLGDADSTRQPAQPIPTASTKSNKVIVNAAKLVPGVGSGFAVGGALILLAFAGAIGGMLAANRASARRR